MIAELNSKYWWKIEHFWNREGNSAVATNCDSLDFSYGICIVRVGDNFEIDVIACIFQFRLKIACSIVVKVSVTEIWATEA